MAYTIGFAVAVVALPALYLIARRAGRAYLAYRGTRVVTCPESAQPAAVEVDAWNAAAVRLEEIQSCLMDRERYTVEWHEVSPETIPHVLATHGSICWSCHVTAKFRREFPHLVVDRGKQPGSGRT